MKKAVTDFYLDSQLNVTNVFIYELIVKTFDDSDAIHARSFITIIIEIRRIYTCQKL
jgi:hypothetical protein